MLVILIRLSRRRWFNMYDSEGRTSTWIIWNSTQKFCLFSFVHLFDNLFTSVWTLGHVFYTYICNPILLYLFCCSNCYSFGYWELFHVYPVSLWRTPWLWFLLLFICVLCLFTFLEFLNFCRYKMLHAHLRSFLPSPRISYFSKVPCFILLQNKDLGATCLLLLLKCCFL